MSIKDIKEKYIDVFLILLLILSVALFVQRFFLNDRTETPEFDPSFSYKPHLVTEVIDGDTIIVDDNREISLLGVDAPKGDECWAKESKEELTDLLKGQNIQLYDDGSIKSNLDILYWYVLLHDEDPEIDTLLVNEYLLREGYARVAQGYQDPVYLDEFLSLQQNATERQKGMWGACPLE